MKLSNRIKVISSNDKNIIATKVLNGTFPVNIEISLDIGVLYGYAPDYTVLNLDTHQSIRAKPKSVQAFLKNTKWEYS